MYIAIDLETTGLNPEKDEIIEFGAIIFDEDGIIKKEYQTFINTNIKIPEIVSQITKITNEDIKNAPKIETLKKEISALLKDKIIVGHNIEFDLAFLKKAKILIPNNTIDTLFLSSALLPLEKSHSLESLCKSLKLQEKSSHNALEDARSAMKLFELLKLKFISLDKKLKSQIKNIIKIPLFIPDDFFSDNKSKKKSLTPISTIPKIKKYSYEENTLNEINQSYESIIPSLITHKNTILSIPGNLINSIEYGNSLKIIDSNEFQIDLKRFSEFISRPRIKPYEIKAIVKILIWTEFYPEKPLRLIKLFNEEKKILKRICKTYNDPFPPIKNKEKIITSHEYLSTSKELFEKIDIIDINNFKQTFYKQNNKYFTLDILLNPLEELINKIDNQKIAPLIAKTTILFGLCGILYDKNKKKDEVNLIITPEIQGKKEIKKIKYTIQNLFDLTKILTKDLSTHEYAIISQWEKYILFLTKSFEWEEKSRYKTLISKQKDEQISISLLDNNFENNFKKFIRKPASLRIFDLSLDLNDNAEFAKTYFQLKKTLVFSKQKSEKRKLSLYPSQNEGLIDKIIKIINNPNHSQILLSANSSTVLKNLTIFLSKKIKDFILISETLGSIGKINEKINNNIKKQIVLISTKNIEKLKNIQIFDTQIIINIPFEQEKLKHQNFEKTIILKSALNLKKIIKACFKAKNTYILDKRITNPNYGKIIQNALSKDFKIEQI